MHNYVLEACGKVINHRHNTSKFYLQKRCINADVLVLLRRFRLPTRSVMRRDHC